MGIHRGRGPSKGNLFQALGSIKTSIPILHTTRDCDGVDFRKFSRLEVLRTNHKIFSQAAQSRLAGRLPVSLRQLEVIVNFPYLLSR